MPELPGKVEQSVQYIFRSYTTSKARFALGLTYRPKNMQVFAFIWGLRDTEIDNLFGSLESFRKFIIAPMLLPSVSGEVDGAGGDDHAGSV